MFRSATLVVLVLCGACDDPPVTEKDGSPLVPADGGPDAPVNRCLGVEGELGTGLHAFQAVNDGDTLHLYRGPQGGYHLWLSVRARGLDPSDVQVCYTETFLSGSENGEVFGQGCRRVRLGNDLGGGLFERLGIEGAVESEYWNESFRIRGEDARVDVTISDRTGCVAEDGWTIHVHEELGR